MSTVRVMDRFGQMAGLPEMYPSLPDKTRAEVDRQRAIRAAVPPTQGRANDTADCWALTGAGEPRH